MTFYKGGNDYHSNLDFPAAYPDAYRYHSTLRDDPSEKNLTPRRRKNRMYCPGPSSAYAGFFSGAGRGQHLQCDQHTAQLHGSTCLITRSTKCTHDMGAPMIWVVIMKYEAEGCILCSLNMSLLSYLLPNVRTTLLGITQECSSHLPTRLFVTPLGRKRMQPKAAFRKILPNAAFSSPLHPTR
jgi:hypothetical protein